MESSSNVKAVLVAKLTSVTEYTSAHTLPDTRVEAQCKNCKVNAYVFHIESTFKLQAICSIEAKIVSFRGKCYLVVAFMLFLIPKAAAILKSVVCISGRLFALNTCHTQNHVILFNRGALILLHKTPYKPIPKFENTKSIIPLYIFILIVKKFLQNCHHICKQYKGLGNHPLNSG